MDIQPFRVSIPQAALDDLQDRLSRTRWPNELAGVGWQYGVPAAYVRRLVEYWRGSYDWCAWEAKLNAYPQFMTEIDGQPLHFLHIRSAEPDALPLIVTHGWPGSVFEYFNLIDHLTNPSAHGAGAGPAFHLVIPTIPGFGFSGPTRQPGWNPQRIARAWAALMYGLGYDCYGAVGNDWGSIISPWLGQLDPEHVVGIHVNQLFLYPSGDPAEFADATPEEQLGLAGLDWFNRNMSAYHMVQAQQPQSLAFALNDSPVGLLAWLCLIYRESIDDDFVLTNASLYWLTDTVASAARIYYEADKMAPLTGPIATPLGLSLFGNDGPGFRRLADRVFTRITRWSQYDRGGHYAAHQAPDVMADDIRAFFAPLHSG